MQRTFTVTMGKIMVDLISESYLLGTTWVSTPQCHMAFAVGDKNLVI